MCAATSLKGSVLIFKTCNLQKKEWESLSVFCCVAAKSEVHGRRHVGSDSSTLRTSTAGSAKIVVSGALMIWTLFILVTMNLTGKRYLYATHSLRNIDHYPTHQCQHTSGTEENIPGLSTMSGDGHDTCRKIFDGDEASVVARRFV